MPEPLHLRNGTCRSTATLIGAFPAQQYALRSRSTAPRLTAGHHYEYRQERKATRRISGSLAELAAELCGNGSQLVGWCVRNIPKSQCLFDNIASRCDIGLLVHWHDMGVGVSVIATTEQERHARHAVERLQDARKTLPQMDDATGDRVRKVFKIVVVLARNKLCVA